MGTVKSKTLIVAFAIAGIIVATHVPAPSWWRSAGEPTYPPAWLAVSLFVGGGLAALFATPSGQPTPFQVPKSWLLWVLWLDSLLFALFTFDESFHQAIFPHEGLPTSFPAALWLLLSYGFLVLGGIYTLAGTISWALWASLRFLHLDQQARSFVSRVNRG